MGYSGIFRDTQARTVRHCIERLLASSYPSEASEHREEQTSGVAKTRPPLCW